MDGKIKIAFFDTKPYDRLTFDEIRERYGFDIDYLETRLTPPSAKLAQGCDVVCAFVNDDLGAETVGELVKYGVKLIAMRSAGFNNVDLAAACGKIDVVRVPKYSPYAVAEYALGMLLCLNRKLHRAYFRVRESNFSINGFMGFDMRGKTVGIIGTGKIGMTFAEILQGFGVKILASDPYPNYEAAKKLGVEYVPLERIYKESDIISLHCPLTRENTHMINAESMAMMKKNVVIINTSRGKLIETQDLIDALKQNRIGGAGLDVYEEEAGYFFEDCSNNGIADDVLARLLTFPNVLVTSHQAFFTREAMDNIAEVTMDNIKSFAEGGPLKNSVCQNCADGRKCSDAATPQ